MNGTTGRGTGRTRFGGKLMRSALFSLAGLLFVSPALRADDAADAKAIIEKAIKARGDKPGAATRRTGGESRTAEEIKARGDKAGAAPVTTTWKEKIALEVG